MKWQSGSSVRQRSPASDWSLVPESTSRVRSPSCAQTTRSRMPAPRNGTRSRRRLRVDLRRSSGCWRRVRALPPGRQVRRWPGSDRGNEGLTPGLPAIARGVLACRTARLELLDLADQDAILRLRDKVRLVSPSRSVFYPELGLFQASAALDMGVPIDLPWRQIQPASKV